ncbi:MAG: LptF/LptG family permease [Bacteroidetes bacterium]|nr:LptF/LptG family permease [Bacteroidota bacterium]
MLSILDKYIIKKFLSTFFFMLGIIMLLAMVFDISERLGEFIDNKAPISDIFLKYYLNFLVYYGNTYSSMIIFLAVIWFTAKMAQDTEIIPILNSGKPFNRFLRPYMIAATLLMIISLILNHFILPRSNKARLDFEENYYRVAHHVEDYHAEFPGNRVIYYTSFNGADSIFNDLVMEKWSPENKLIYFIKARTAKYDVKSENWIFSEFYERKVSPDGDDINEGSERRIALDFKTEDIASRQNIVEAMNYTELRDFIQKEKLRGSPSLAFYELEFYQRTSLPFASYVLTIIGVSVASRKKRGGIGVNIAIGLGIVFVYIFAMKVMAVATSNLGFPSAIAVWVPNMLFAGIAYLLYRNALR